MAASCKQTDLEDYIDMEIITSSSNLYSYNPTTINSPPQNREFEFQISSISNEIDTASSPADELFYKGKLLPLHLPPRLQMVQKIFHTTNNNKAQEHEEQEVFISSSKKIPSTNTSTTPILESSRLSCELNQVDHEYFSNCETHEMRVLIDGHDHTNTLWSKKLKQIKQSSLSQKLKASKAYLKSLFSKPSCSDGSLSLSSFAKPTTLDLSSDKFCLNPKKIPTTLMKSIEKEMEEETLFNNYRRSFSGVINQRYYSGSCSSSSSLTSFSFSSSGSCDLRFLKRNNNSSLSEIESSIEGAIAHCKQSQKLFKTSNQNGICSVSTPIIAVCGDQER